MQIVPQTIHHIARPGIAAVYKKRDFTTNKHSEDVLVIETSFANDDDDHESFESFMTDLLIDLPDIKKQAELETGPIDRIDIRSL